MAIGTAPRSVAFAKDLGLRGALVVVMLSAEEIVWAPVRGPDVVMRMRYDRITGFDVEPLGIRLTERDAEYARSLSDPNNPYGETDFLFTPTADDNGEELLHELSLALFQRAPAFEEARRQVRGLRARQGIPVETWSDCPFCGGALSSQAKGGASCSSCQRCYCDPDLQPVVSDAPETHGYISEVRAWTPLLEGQRVAAGKTTTWVYRPSGQAIGPSVILDTRILKLMEQFPD